MMSGDMLSQDEIDALLRGTDDDESSESIDPTNFEDLLTLMEKDALGEIGNISFGSSATALSTLLNQKVEITTPTVAVVSKENLSDEFPIPYVGIQVSYTQGFSGSNVLVIKQSDAAIIVDLMLGGEGTNPSELMDEIQLSAVQEAMNQMMGSAATSMSTVFNKRVDISPPTINVLDIEHGQGTDQLPDDELFAKVSFRLKVGSLIDSTIMQLLPLDFAKELVNELMNPTQYKTEEPTQYSKDSSSEIITNSGNQQHFNEIAGETNTGFSSNQSSNMYQHEGEGINPYPPQARPAAQQYQQHPGYQSGPQHIGTAFHGAEQPSVQPAVFSTFEPQQIQGTDTKNLSMLLDIPLQVTVELGRTKRTVQEILEISSGSIIELDKLAGEPVDILVNSRLIAKGEVVVIDENFGVRVTDIISQTDRLKNLR
ncbi:flagellar motor switch phosphatase FliY [Neobacillus sp. PS3-40]|uniref:flagellar motor switch phosphatase FliY n=1 Tax=Neobacillus sp. PS3-40 TaxID=3070679 RepID=UPI0027E16D81|nr:flagellar motor switch phosphatase FliY [Neobacillus sp. PS3-40]WML43711.1 flagellar motor switch phosphatase FliY [Neobacillus sp. PS3-40]